ncbi:liprin-beta-1 [Glossina fuscipes]|uniref:Liprin-beta-1 n=1 Tax=Glossina fuscipes TaxID=7396 RepID=A0A8U0W4U4_9MUSC|nr:liprin-beta-1 [Glossina fuscipes]KAI9588049.1 hypothetical protein GQX74_003895 [Glossina fuscipes]
MESKETAEASKMLEAALQQMDGIISGATSNSNVIGVGGGGGGSGGGGVCITTSAQAMQSSVTATSGIGSHALSERNLISANNVLSTAKTLALALEQVGLSAPAPDVATATTINDWLEQHMPRQDADERLRRLQRDKESLALQYQMVADEVCEQADKIIELEGLLAEKTQQLSVKEELLQRQICTRSELETQKLQLMTALSELKLHRAALERENLTLKNFENLSNSQDLLKRLQAYGSMGNLPQLNYISQPNKPKTPPSLLRHQIHPQFHSLPRSHCTKNDKTKLPWNSQNHNNNNRFLDEGGNKQRNVAFASNEKILIEDVTVVHNSNVGNDVMYGSFISQINSTPSPNLRERSAKSIRNILGKLRRSNSGNLELPTLEQAEPEFRRGDRARATAGGRIEWSGHSSQASTNSKSCLEWTAQEVGNWLCDLGFRCYEEDCRKWLKNNTTNFFMASSGDLEKELNIKLPLHRKKILLAIDELTGKETDLLALKASQLDIGWVLRWLDDIGLPQYKDNFLMAKIDGRLLHRLTMEDLLQLNVSSCLHIASLRRAIQCMREMEWNPECLIRRSTKIPKRNSSDTEDKSSDVSDESDTSPEFIALWTAHRVMEWLRVADLSEYAPNLRGAGVHGALMLYEPKFTANLLADLLSIPPSKTLLRRHLATHFKELLGRSIIQEKRNAETLPGYQALTISAKIKPPKKSQFSLKRRKSTKGLNCASTDKEWSEYVCPMTTSTAQMRATTSNDQCNNKISAKISSNNNSNNTQTI